MFVSEHNPSGIQAYDNFLDPHEHAEVFSFLKEPGWAFGAYSDPAPNASRYWYKHFAGYVKDGRESKNAQEIETELAAKSPLLSRIWDKIKTGIVKGHGLSRCYANAYHFGSEGGMHLDSNIDNHMTIIYYPALSWHPNFAGETVFFNASGDDIIASVYPKPNRLVVFPGVIPHVARGVSRIYLDLRITLMFKTTGPTSFPTATTSGSEALGLSSCT